MSSLYRSDESARRLSPGAKGWLAIEIAVALSEARTRLRRQQLPALVAAVRAQNGTRAPRWGRTLPDGRRDGQRLGAAVSRVAERMPGETLCLLQSLALLRLLARRGCPDAQLIIAVRPNGALSIDAHAWVELDGCALLSPGGADFDRLVSL